jgi:glycosyltransferase involved in cell wall biosynthesis
MSRVGHAARLIAGSDSAWQFEEVRIGSPDRAGGSLEEARDRQGGRWMDVLALVEAPEHVCCRYRVRAFEPALAKAGARLHVKRIASGPAGRLRQILGVAAYDAVLLQRKLLPLWQIRLLRLRARRLIFDFDDAVLYRDSYDPRGPHCRRRSRRFASMVRAADLVIAGNDFLASKALEAGAGRGKIRLIPTCVDTQRYTPRSWSDGTSLKLVWIGSSSTLQGIELQRSLWCKIGRAVPQAKLRVISDRFPSFEGIAVERVPWSEAREAAELRCSDVGISWIPDDLWSQGKCGLKILQYQAAGLPVIANPVGVHPVMVEQGVSGFLPKNAEQWVEAVRALAASVALRRHMGEAARSNVESNYSVGAWSHAFVAATAGASSGSHAGSRPPHAAHKGANQSTPEPNLRDAGGRDRASSKAQPG